MLRQAQHERTSLAPGLSPLLSGWLAARAGARAVWLACLAAGILVALGHLATAGPRRRRLAARAEEPRAAAGER